MKAITTKYFGPTNFKGSRIKASDMDGNQVTVSYDHALNADANHRAAAEALCSKMSWTAGTLCQGAIKGGYAFVFAG